MVIARSWAEQRVLMRAFAECEDQTRPTITLHGAQLAIGPAGLDPHGEWGIHVEPPVDGRAQELREALQLAAKLLAGSKGNPPRLQDEVSDFEGRATQHWKPALAAEPAPAQAPYYEPATRAPQSLAAELPRVAAVGVQRAHLRKTPPFWGNTYATPELVVSAPDGEELLRGKSSAVIPNILAAQPLVQGGAVAAAPSSRSLRNTFRYSGAVVVQKQPLAETTNSKKTGAKTVHGFSSVMRQNETYAVIAGKTMPLGFALAPAERRVLEALGKSCLTATEVGALLGVPDPMNWMSSFMDRLTDLGLDLVAPGDDLNGEPTYILSR